MYSPVTTESIRAEDRALDTLVASKTLAAKFFNALHLGVTVAAGLRGSHRKGGESHDEDSFGEHFVGGGFGKSRD